MSKIKGKILGKLKRKLAYHIYLVRFLLFSFLIALVIWLASLLLPTSLRLIKNLLEKSLASFHSSQELKSNNGRINFLIMGIGGSNHQGADLTDTIIFFSIDTQGKDFLLLSLPRDIWIPSMRAKINTAYHYGEEKKPGGGLILAKAAVSEILDQPVHYSLVINFAGFVKAIDLLGGVEVNVERAFDDYKYPIPGMETAEPEESRYEHLHFDASKQIMSGERALKYVRSRYAEGEEGTDFARSKRQQQLISALKNRLFSTQLLVNPQKIPQLVKTLADSIDTDITEAEYLPLFKLAVNFKQKDFRTGILDSGEEGRNGLLINPSKDEKYDYQWVLVPRTGDWQEIQEYVASLIQAGK